MLVAVFLQRRNAGTDAPRETPFPRWLRVVFLVEGCGMAVAGLALFIVPDTTRSAWPWTLTALTARAIGAWFLALGVITFHAIQENDLQRIRPFGGGLTSFAALELLALARYSGNMNWGVPGAWLYLAFLLTLFPVGLYAWFGPNVMRGLGFRRTQ
jgi:hypothetical protein